MPGTASASAAAVELTRRAVMKPVPFLLLLLLILGGCHRSEPPAAAADRPPTAVHVAPVAMEQAVRAQDVAGTVRPFDRATVAARIMGAVTESHLAVGRAVPAGEILVRLQAAEIGAQADEARAALRQAERDFTREQALAAKGASTAETVRDAADRRAQAQAAVAAAGARQDYTEVPAPFAGVITAEYVKPGDLASPGRPLFAIEGTDRLRAEVQVPENLPVPATGAPLRVTWADGAATGTLVELSPATDPTTRTRLAKVELPSGTPVASGAFVRVSWPAETAVRLTVPATAVRRFGQMEQVFVVVDGRARLRLVRTGDHAGAAVGINAGLDAGEVVIVAPPAPLRDGDPVKVSP